MPPYAQFLVDFDRKHSAVVHRNSAGNTRAAVIIETRPQFLLPRVIRNVMCFLGPSWNLHLLCGPYAYGYLRDRLAGWQVGATRLSGDTSRFSIRDYNAILLSPEFWNRLREDKILIFQHDSLLADRTVEDFIDYDYVGAPCGRLDEQYIANGGLSLRTRQVMLACLARFDPEPDEPEDVYFTRAVRRLGASMPDFATACRFCVESVYLGHPFGVHATNRNFHSVEVARRIVDAIRY